jgi:hypothetical protein
MAGTAAARNGEITKAGKGQLMHSGRKPRWQQVTALVSLGAGGAITGFSFVPKAAADLTSPTGLPVRLMALEQSAKAAAAPDAVLRSAIVNISRYYLHLATVKTPAEMEAIIWQHDSLDGADHGPSCAAFASLTLELAAHVVGQQSWVTGGTSYPWPLHTWADARVDPNPSSPGIVSIVQDAQAHRRWHPLGDGYQPAPGDWVLFSGHVEVVTGHSGGELHTIGADSLPNYSVNAHTYPAPLAEQGITGFVNNGTEGSGGITTTASGAIGAAATPVSDLATTGQPANVMGGKAAPAQGRRADRGRRASLLSSATDTGAGGVGTADIPGEMAAASAPAALPVAAGGAAIPGVTQAAAGRAWHAAARGHDHQHGGAVAPAQAGQPLIPGVPSSATPPPGTYRRHDPGPTPPVSHGGAQQAFIGTVAPGAIAAQRRYGVPAAVTIAQAIEESGWGQSSLATRDHNLFGIKGTGPAGSDSQPTQEYLNGQWVATTAPFRVYHDAAQSIDDHGRLLATSGYYGNAMAVRHDPNAFAAALTGVYATDPEYGTKIISIMRQYNLYRYDAGRPATGAPARPTSVARGSAAIPGVSQPPPTRATAVSRSGPPKASPGTPGGKPAGPSRHAPGLVADGSGAPHGALSAGKPAGAAFRSGTAGSTHPSGGTQPGKGRAAGTASSRAPAGHTTARIVTSGNAPGGWNPVTASSAAGSVRDPARAPASRTDRFAPHAPATESGGPSGAAAARGSATARSPLAHAASRPEGAATSRPAGPSGAPALGKPRLPAAGSSQREQGGTREPRPEPRPVPEAVSAVRLTAFTGPAAAATPQGTSTPARRYKPQIPTAVRADFNALARVPLQRGEAVYRDVAREAGIPWQVLAACDWMQCHARARYSPVHGERLGTVNPDGASYPTKSAALAQCAEDLVEVALVVYGIDLTRGRPLSVPELANAFAAFRWGGLLRAHHTSAMEFPYSVAGLTIHHLHMRWPAITARHAPDRPGARFRPAFGAVPTVLLLNYPATA